MSRRRKQHKRYRPPSLIDARAAAIAAGLLKPKPAKQENAK